jgi:hypothetical protein
MANRTPGIPFIPFVIIRFIIIRFISGGFPEVASGCLASRTLATRSAIMFRTPLPMIAAEALVTIAMAEPVTAA